MKIVRDGKEIELTAEEMRQAYDEMEDMYRREDIENRYELPDDKVDEALRLLAKTINFNDGYWDAYWNCIDSVAMELKLKDIYDE